MHVRDNLKIATVTERIESSNNFWSYGGLNPPANQKVPGVTSLVHSLPVGVLDALLPTVIINPLSL